MSLSSECDVFPDDPAAAFVYDHLLDQGMTVHHVPDLGAPYAANADTGRIWLPTGLDWEDAHARIDRAWLFLLGGPKLAPEFGQERVTGQGNVIHLPLLRRAW